MKQNESISGILKLQIVQMDIK